MLTQESQREAAVSCEKVGDGSVMPHARTIFKDRPSDDPIIELSAEKDMQLPKVGSPTPNIEMVDCDKSVEAIEKHQFMRKGRKRKTAAALRTPYTATGVRIKKKFGDHLTQPADYLNFMAVKRPL
ncbi:hypothetical protein ACOSP7_009972 [Xanthoceras sorbifolium]